MSNLWLWKAGYNQTEIAKEIGVHKSTISREFKRNTQLMRTQLGCWQYKTHYAHINCFLFRSRSNELGSIMDQLNNRARKLLGLATPMEVFYSNSQLHDFSW